MKTSIISLFTYKELTKIIKCHNLHETSFVKGTKNYYNYNYIYVYIYIYIYICLWFWKSKYSSFCHKGTTTGCMGEIMRLNIKHFVQ